MTALTKNWSLSKEDLRPWVENAAILLSVGMIIIPIIAIIWEAVVTVANGGVSLFSQDQLIIMGTIVMVIIVSIFVTSVKERHSRWREGTEVKPQEYHPHYAPIRFILRHTAGYVTKRTAVVLFCGLFFCVPLIAMNVFVPHVLTVPAESMRIMTDSGQVLLPGETILAPRYTPSSKVLVLSNYLELTSSEVGYSAGSTNSLLSQSITTVSEKGEVTSIVTVQLKVLPNDALKQLVAGHGAEATSASFYAETLSRQFLQPLVRQVVTEVQNGKCSGSSAAMLLRLGQLVELHRKEFPAWANASTFRIDSIAIDNWMQMNEDVD